MEQQEHNTITASTSTEVEELSLFDLNSFTAASDYEVDTEGYDPSWDILEKSLEATPPIASIPLSETASLVTGTVSQSSQPVQQFNLKELADRVREIDLEVVAASLGLEQDRHDHHKWKDTEHIISISGSKFMDWT